MISKRLFGSITLAATIAVGLASAPAGATGSIAAGDTTTRQVGHAFASCTAFLGSTDSLQGQIYWPAVKDVVDDFGVHHTLEVGAVVAQAFYSGNPGAKLRDLLVAGWTPRQIVDEMNRVAALPTINGGQDLADPTQDPHGLFDRLFQARQYEITSLTAPSATFSGSSKAPGTVLNEWSEATTGSFDATTGAPTSRFVGAAAGNTLTSKDFAPLMAGTLQAPQTGRPVDVVAALAELGVTVAPADVAAMHKGDLAERLFLSLEAGFGRPGQGDVRCVWDNPGGTVPPAGTPLPPYSRSSSMSWLRVDNTDGSVAMNLRYRSSNVKDAARELGRLYYACRMNRGTNPCMANESDNSPRASTQNFSYSFMSQPGNVLGQGQSLSYGPAESKFSSGYDGRNLAVTVTGKGDTWIIQMTPPREQIWVNGATYLTEGGARNNVAALNLTRNGAQCSRPFGSLKMNNIAFSGTSLTALSVDFSGVTCQGGVGTLGGQLRFTA